MPIKANNLNPELTGPTGLIDHTSSMSRSGGTESTSDAFTDWVLDISHEGYCYSDIIARRVTSRQYH